MKQWNPHRRKIADDRKQAELEQVCEELRRKDQTAEELLESTKLSLFQVRRALRAGRAAMRIAWLPLKTKKPHAYSRIYLATSDRRPEVRRRKRA